ncbi:MAG: acetyl-CoA carboxylase biotin carboxylase subunit [Planctomycetota bacterium]|jgi:acetyl-CoA carboxylase biotin carboxylase subunit
MFRRILIANRGEIALRIIRACREIGVQTVAVYSEADRDASYLSLADERICIGGGPAAESYLNIPRIISAAEIADVDAVHPGYGFLAESPHFAEICESCNIAFIGPSAKVIASMGDKVEARDIARGCKVPVVPGSDGAVENETKAQEIARKIGYPVMIKAAAGGGGRGMRVAHNDISLVKSFIAARAEADAAFKNPVLYVEKFVDRPRHVEIQILADRFGNVLHLGERDCTIQRRHQKLIEESPSPGISKSLRRDLGEAAVRLCKNVEYVGVGTVEFLVDHKEDFYFIEMNTRIQVEHPVTELVTGIDLIKEQLQTTCGERLRLRQKDIRFEGSSMECRVNAEDPGFGFKPSPGRIDSFIIPGGPGVRVDTHAYAGYTISSYYDSLVAKVLVHRPTRREAMATMRRALGEFVVAGIKTNIPLHERILGHSAFLKGDFDTGFIENVMTLE